MTKPREFWIYIRSKDDDIDAPMYDISKFEPVNKKYIPVIEKAAYDKAIEALKFYGLTNHLSGDWDNVSGEPTNILLLENCECDIDHHVESGAVARKALVELGIFYAPDPDLSAIADKYVPNEYISDKVFPKTKGEL